MPEGRKNRSLTKVFLEDIYSIPDGEKIRECIQCGTCSASCPTSYAMDYTPREVIAALRAGILDRVLKSNTIWLCASCYSCTVRCPSGIKLTDVMYELKRLAVEFNLVEKQAKAPVVSKLFVDLVDQNGRISEVSLVGKFMLKTNPFAAIGMMPRAWKLLIRGRMPLIPRRIKRISELEKLVSTTSEIGLHVGRGKIEKVAA